MFQYLFEGINNKSINDKTIHKLKDRIVYITSIRFVNLINAYSFIPQYLNNDKSTG